MSDAQLVTAANGGASRALDTLYVRYRSWVHGLALRYCGDAEDALDVTQDAFLYLVRKFPGFELRCQMKTFLYPVVHNIAVDRMRKRGRSVPLNEDWAQNLPETRERARPDPGAREEFSRLVAALPDEQREVVILRFEEDLQLSEIAQQLGIPLGTVKSRLHNALRMLKGMNLFGDTDALPVK